MNIPILVLLSCSSDTRKDTAQTQRTPVEDSSDNEPASNGEPAADTAPQESTSEQTQTYVSTLSSGELYTLEYAPEEVADNPFRGFLSSYSWSDPANDFPHALEFRYLPLSSVVVDEGVYDYTNFEEILNSAQDRENHLIVRFYLDYPALASGMPAHLAETVSCTLYEDYGGGCTPDYSDPNLLSTLLGFVDDFGLNYDGDHRLAFVQIGLLGFWGEWHTYPHTELFASDQIQQDVITAFDEAFSTTPVQLRYPAQDSPSRDIGFHDDSFGYATIGETAWFFQPRLENAGAAQAWQTTPIGGEVYPPLQSILFTQEYTIEAHQQDMQLCLEHTHASYLLNYFAFSGAGTGYTDLQKQEAETFALGMGYQYTIPELSIELSHLDDQAVDVHLSIVLINKGSAPSYHPMTLNLLWNDEVHELVELQNLLPEESHSVDFSASKIPVPVAQTPFELFISSPLALPGQQIKLANQNSPAGTLLIHHPVFCDYGGEPIDLGATVELEEHRCTCDVDGELYTVDLEPCTR